ncbi:hypothetical protein BDV19DRAFT_383326 [Aspergillus venezuelensis]
MPESPKKQSTDDRSRPVPEVPVFDVEQDTRKYILADGEWVGDFFPKETRRVSGLVGKSKIIIKDIVENQLFQEISDGLLTTKSKFWIGVKQDEAVSRPQLNNTIIFSVNPVARAQTLHRDDMIHHNRPSSIRVEDYKIGQDVEIGANGATRFIRGSHLWALETPPDESLVVHAELKPGGVFVFFSSCYHGGSANTTPDEERLLYSFFMTKGYLRQEENQYLASKYETVLGMYDDVILARLGYSVSVPFLGWVDLKHPLDALRGETKLRDLY